MVRMVLRLMVKMVNTRQNGHKRIITTVEDDDWLNHCGFVVNCLLTLATVTRSSMALNHPFLINKSLYCLSLPLSLFSFRAVAI